MDSRRWTGHAAIVFGTLAYLLSLLTYIVSTYTSSLAHLRDGLSHEDFAVFSLSEGARFVGGTTVGTALVAASLWYLVVERVQRWPLSRRATLAGALTGWLSFPVALIPVVAPTLTGEFASPVVGVAVGVGAAGLVGLVIAPLFAGWVTIPACALVGYVLARRRIDTEGPTAGDH